MVGYPHDIKGQGIYAYVTLNAGENPNEEMRKELFSGCARTSGRIASPGPNSVGAGAAQDPLGQDHAPHLAQDRRERCTAIWGHLDPGRSLQWLTI